MVARGIVPSSLCTPQAFAQINLNIAHLVRDYIWIIDQLKKWIAYVLKLTLFTRIHVCRALNLIWLDQVRFVKMKLLILWYNLILTSLTFIWRLAPEVNKVLNHYFKTK